jgi:hypothetical protein
MLPTVDEILRIVCKLPDFKKKVAGVATARHQEASDVEKAAANAYRELPKHVLGTPDGLEIVQSHHAPADFAAFIALIEFLQERGGLAIDLEVVEDLGQD